MKNTTFTRYHYLLTWHFHLVILNECGAGLQSLIALIVNDFFSFDLLLEILFILNNFHNLSRRLEFAHLVVFPLPCLILQMNTHTYFKSLCFFLGCSRIHVSVM